MKSVLILAIGCNLSPWDKMFETSSLTWDSIQVDGVNTIFYFGSPKKENTDKAIYFDIKESYGTMGEKLLQALEWCLKNKSFDYIARVNSSCYVDKTALIQHVQSLPEYNYVAGIEVEDNPKWLWGGGQYIISKDVIEKIVNNRNHWNHSLIEDKGLSDIVTKLGIQFSTGKSCTIDKADNDWRCLCYGSESYTFKDFKEIKKGEQHFYRVKQDYDRNIDAYIMNELFKTLQHD